MTLDPKRAKGKQIPSIPQASVPLRRSRITDQEREEILGRLTNTEEEEEENEIPPLQLYDETEESDSVEE